MRYDEALDALGKALKFGINPGLEHIRTMCAVLGNPQDAFACVQVAGTNGKSSVARMTAALLRQAGRHVGLYTSPELVRYPERMEVDGMVVSDQRFADAVEAAQRAAAEAGVEATEFELLTAGALWLFAQEGVDAAVLECGLGGRWDATSVCIPRVAVITGIGLDHTAVLGNTVEQVAAEKAAIVKPGCTAVLARQLAAHEVFVRQASEVGAEVVEVDAALEGVFASAVAHLPHYQLANAALAYTAANVLLAGEDASGAHTEAAMRAAHAVTLQAAEAGALPLALCDAKAALGALQIPGRFETLREQPLLLIDAAHNPQSAQVLAGEIRRRFAVAGAQSAACDKPPVPTLLLGVLADKDVRGVVHELVPLFENVVVTASSSPRAVVTEQLLGIVLGELEGCAHGYNLRKAESIPDALAMLANEDVLACGSVTVAGEVKNMWLQQAAAHTTSPA